MRSGFNLLNLTHMTLRILAAGLFLAAAALSWAQSAYDQIAVRPERAGGVYYAYPEGESLNYGAVPAGYEPFYLSHYGRHGSRYLISDNDYRRVMNRLAHAEAAGALTPAGMLLKAQMDTIWEEARGRGGELTPLGARQHRGIARRAAAAYPKIFADGAIVEAASTPVMRCAHSMFAFIEGIKEFNPSLQVSRESAERNMYYLNYHSPESGPYSSHDGPWYQDYKRFRAAQTNPGRLMPEIFADSAYVARWVDPSEFMTDLYWVAVDMQNMETAIDLLPLFTTGELYDLWQIYNYSFYATNSSYPLANGEFTANARNLVHHIVEHADSAIATGSHGATLRFGHDGNIIPLTALLAIDGCASDAVAPADLAADYANFRISPMASNLQMVFFRPKRRGGDVLVKIYLNEREATIPVATDAAGFYPWPRLREYLLSL